MPDNETTHIRPHMSGVYRNYVVVAADMATYTGDSIDGCQVVYTSATNEEDALATACNALEDGFIPVVSFDADSLRKLADLLESHPLKPEESYNQSTDITDAEIAEQSVEHDE